MRKGHAFDDAAIVACLYRQHGLRITTLSMLALGNDVHASVYRAEADDGTS